MRNLIVSYKKLPEPIRETLLKMFPNGYEDEAFEFEIPQKKMICKAIRVSIEGVNYVIKLDQWHKHTDYLLDDDW